MTALIGYYQQRKPTLEEQLRKVQEDPKKVVNIVQDEIRRLADINGEYMGELTPSQARLAKEMLAELNHQFSLLTAAKLQNPVPSKQPLNHSQLTAKGDSLRQSGVSATAAVAGAATGAFFGGPLGFAFGTIIGVTVGVVAQSTLGKDTDISVEPERHKPELRIDINALLSNLQKAFEAIDRAVDAYDTEEKPQKPGLEDYPDLLEFLQDLMEDALDEKAELPTTTRKRIGQVPMILRHYGIDAQVYQPGEEQTSEIDPWSKFDFEPSLDPEIRDYVTLKPAFVKGGQVLKRGRVIEPASSRASV